MRLVSYIKEANCDFDSNFDKHLEAVTLAATMPDASLRSREVVDGFVAIRNSIAPKLLAYMSSSPYYEGLLSVVSGQLLAFAHHAKLDGLEDDAVRVLLTITLPKHLFMTECIIAASIRQSQNPGPVVDAYKSRNVAAIWLANTPNSILHSQGFGVGASGAYDVLVRESSKGSRVLQNMAVHIKNIGVAVAVTRTLDFVEDLDLLCNCLASGNLCHFFGVHPKVALPKHAMAYDYCYPPTSL